MVDITPFLPGLSPVQGKAVVARFDGGRLSSEGGLLVLSEIERRLGLADRLAGCLNDPRMPARVAHRLAEIIRFRLMMIAASDEDGNDADTLRSDPMFKLGLDRLPSGEELCSQSTISRLENLPDRRALLRLGRAPVEQYCGSFGALPKRIVLDMTTRSTECTAASSCACSTSSMTITASNQLLSSTARDVSSLPCCGPASGPAGSRFAPLSAASSAPSPVTPPRPTSFVCSCTPAPIGSYGRWAGSCRKRSAWRVVQFDTLRLRLVKLAAENAD
jgi:hypothetical protein